MNRWPRLSVRRPGPPAGVATSVRRTNLLQTFVTVLIALTVTAAALLSSHAAGEWSSALREEIKRSAATLETLEYVYGDEAPQAFQIAIAETRARQLRRHAVTPSTGGALAVAEATTETQVAGHLRQAHRATGGLVDGDRYQLADGGFDVARRVGDVQRAGGEPISLDPDRTQARGDRARHAATVISALVFPLILGYLMVAVRNQRRRQSRRTSGGGSAGGRAPTSDDVGLIPQPLGQDGRGRFAVVFPLLAWTILTAIAPAQLYFANQEQRATNLAARLAIQATTDIAGSHALSTFRFESARVLLIMQAQSYAREFAALDMDDRQLASEQRAISAADRAALPPLRQIAATMAHPPGIADGATARTHEVTSSGSEDWASVGRQQKKQAELAEHAGLRGNILQLTLLMAALSLSLFALAATQSFGNSMIVSHAACGLLLAACVAAGTGLVL